MTQLRRIARSISNNKLHSVQRVNNAGANGGCWVMVAVIRTALLKLTDTRGVKTMITALVTSLDKCFKFVIDEKQLTVTTLLDPTFRDCFMPPQIRPHEREWLVDKVMSRHDNQNEIPTKRVAVGSSALPQSSVKSCTATLFPVPHKLYSKSTSNYHLRQHHCPGWPSSQPSVRPSVVHCIHTQTFLSFSTTTSPMQPTKVTCYKATNGYV